MSFWNGILRLAGWDVDKTAPVGVKKMVIVVGPHTSNWDFVIGYLALRSYKVKAKFLIKKELFVGPLGWFLKRAGGIPVDRKNKNHNFTDQAVRYFTDNEEMFLIFTPEATRSYNPNWKLGFYYIAKRAKVPIYICYLDYKNKKGGFLKPFEMTEDVDADIAEIKATLSQFEGRFPENGIRRVEEE
ncbi:1-acyl-sn-glycerol-3-phosphate acyltransferases [Lishizhenia tianjinensis]|uniref:1-acyl-sn-glycerol-3-phosphate acyltransferases n=1 Tax=Lishizhenia tianjinensis TaxID=477690 RepID=A0A1I6XRU2_9FLAO|nr:1-acyl-sn-glycerol-3-phosphate acyltransferase [Lishizhenia tianjinensis]SFT41239.1 1-acyl-sn-glycerol-3-phosphate acyltransferases [Lishizhenia tianjinensis]